jgi:hypothetical protein
MMHLSRISRKVTGALAMRMGQAAGHGLQHQRNMEAATTGEDLPALRRFHRQLRADAAQPLLEGGIGLAQASPDDNGPIAGGLSLIQDRASCRHGPRQAGAERHAASRRCQFESVTNR